ncbi:MAG: YMGG-like glycine zipper-containing protein [Pseudomonadota bacterium]
MKKIIVIFAAVLALSACNATQRGAAVGAGTGAAIGAVATGSGRGAAVGAVAGGLAGALIGRASEDGKCRYRGRDGRVYIDDC